MLRLLTYFLRLKSQQWPGGTIVLVIAPFSTLLCGLGAILLEEDSTPFFSGLAGHVSSLLVPPISIVDLIEILGFLYVVLFAAH